MLKVDHLTITTHKQRTLVRDFSVTLNPGDKIALIGEEGNGKSTILKVLAGIDISDYASYTGTILADEPIGYLPQDIPAADLRREVSDYITDGEMDYTRLYEIIRVLKLDETLVFDRILSSLSGGEKIRIALARLLYGDPGILLLDEPTNNLDLKALLWLEAFIRSTTLPLIFISHDETLLENCANGILHLEQLKRKTESALSYSGENYPDYRSRRGHLIERNNRIAQKEKAEYHKQLQRYQQIYQSVESALRSCSRQDPATAAALKRKVHAMKAQQRHLDEQKENLREKYEPEEAINIRFEEVKLNPNKVILDFHLDRLQAGENVLVETIDLHVLAREKICIIGDNGSGKSTLLKMIWKNLKDRTDIRVGYMPQNYQEVMDFNKTPLAFLCPEGDRETLTRAATFLGSLKFTTEEMNHAIGALSEGQKCKVLFAGLILSRCEVLLLDEPTRNLSPLSNPRIREILGQFKGTIIAVSHDRKLIDEVMETVYELTDTLTRLE